MSNKTVIVGTEFGNDRLKALLLYLRFCTKGQSRLKEEATGEEKKVEKV